VREECQSRLATVFVEHIEKCLTNFAKVSLHCALVLRKQHTLPSQFLWLDQEQHWGSIFAGSQLFRQLEGVVDHQSKVLNVFDFSVVSHLRGKKGSVAKSGVVLLFNRDWFRLIGIISVAHLFPLSLYQVLLGLAFHKSSEASEEGFPERVFFNVGLNFSFSLPFI